MYKTSILSIFLCLTFLSVIAVMGFNHYPGYSLKDSLAIPSDGSPVNSNVILTNGINYLIEASGTWVWDKFQDPNWVADARWFSDPNWLVCFDEYNHDVNGIIDPGLRILGFEGDDVWGGYDPNHIYTIQTTGISNRLTFYIHDEFNSGIPAYTDNQGYLTVRIYEEDNNFIPGQSYFGRNQYIEYIAGNSPVIITAPHGGALTPSEIPNRTWGTMDTDINTDLLAYKVYDAFYSITGLYPHVVICHLKRTKLDANREISEAAQTNQWAEYAWHEWQGFIETASNSAIKQAGSGIYMDIHGQNHSVQRLEIGYLLSNAILQLDDNDLNNYSDLSSVRALATDPNFNFAELIRGQTSFGGLMEAKGYPSIPSPQYPDAGDDIYYSRGYNTEQQGSLHGGRISGFQLEFNYTRVRDTEENCSLTAKALSESLVPYLLTYFKIDIHNLSISTLAAVMGNWLDDTRQPRQTGQLIGHWSFDDGTANDSSGHGHHGTLVQGDPLTSIEIVYDQERNSDVLYLKNPPGHTINSVVDCGGNSLRGGWADIRNAITVSAWIKVKEFHVALQNVITKGGSYQLTRCGTTNGMRTSMCNLTPDLNCSEDVNDGNWHHVAVVYDPNQSKRILYVDGQKEGSDRQSAQLMISSDTFVIGGRLSLSFENKGWYGWIDEVKLFNYALNSEEIMLISHGSPLPPPNPVLECYQIAQGDLNMDCKSDLLDFLIVANNWLKY